MCGFAGFAEFQNSNITLDDLLSMQQAVRHRGPDDHGYYFTPKLGFCHNRLSIIDLSEKAHQPMRRGHLSIVYNGEVYNFLELRKELSEAGSAFESVSDTEVVLEAFRRWGMEALLKLNGMFSFMIYDHVNEKMFFARDRFGIKPFVYYWDGLHFAFASEIKALTKYPHFKKKLSIPALRSYLCFGYPAGSQTIWENCYHLLPGHFAQLDVKSAHLEIGSYWNPFFTVTRMAMEPEDCLEELKRVLHEEFRRSMLSDVPVGACISGGVDSNVLIGILAKDYGFKLRTYSFGSDDAVFNENSQAEKVAGYLGLSHTSIRAQDDLCREELLETIAHFDEPIAEQNALSFRLIAKQARKDGVYVLLSGIGGDELFLGYPGVFRRALIELLFYLPKCFRRLIPKEYFRRFNKGFKFIQLLHLGRYIDAIKCMTGGCLYTDEIDSLLIQKNEFPGNHCYFEELFNEAYPSQTTTMEKIMRCDLMHYMPGTGLYLSDISSMSQGVEIRVPYLNNHVADLMLGVTTRVKFHGYRLKALLKSVERQYYPEELLLKKKRNFYPFVKDIWLNRYLKDDLLYYLSKEKITGQGLFNHEALMTIMNQGRGSRVKVDNKIWNLLMFQIWAERNL